MNAGRRRGLIAAGSLAGHALVVAVLVGLSPSAPAPVETPAMVVRLVTLAPPPPEPPPPVPEPAPDPKPSRPKPAAKAVKPAPPKPAPLRASRPAKAVPTVAPVLAVAGPVSMGASEVSDAELAGAQTSGSDRGGTGDGGRACNMARFLEGKLRKDRRVQAAMAEARPNGAVRVWNGGWVRHGDQEGSGLATVREAIMWEVAFAPEACRREPVRGLVVLALSDGPGGARVALGAGDWRWTDLLGARARR